MPLQSRDLERLRGIVPGTGALAIRPLCAGLSNETYRVTREGRTFALRLTGAGRNDLGLDRRWQAQLQTEAADRGFAPRVVYSDPLQGMLLSEWVDGRSWPGEEASTAANIVEVAALARRIQALTVPPQTSVMSPKHWIDLYTAATARRGLTPLSDEQRGVAALAQPSRGSKRPDERLRAAAGSALEQLARLPTARPTVCHSDLHSMNLIERGETLILLDWEYAHVGEPLWDLAGWSANNDFPLERRQALLSAYLGAEPAAMARQRFELLCWLYDYVCLLWSELYLCDDNLSAADTAGMGGVAGMTGAAGVGSVGDVGGTRAGTVTGVAGAGAAGGLDRLVDVADRATLLDARLRLAAH